MSRLTKLGWAGAVAVPALFLLGFFAWPVGEMLVRGFVDDAGSLDLSGFGEVLGQKRTWRIVGQTLWMAAAGTLGSVALGVPGAWVLYRLRVPGRGLARAIVSVPFVLPTVVVGIAFRTVLRDDGWYGFLGLDGTTTAVVLAMVFFNFSVVVRTVGTMWAGLDPRQEEAARTLGASPWRAFRTVTLPQLGPSIAAAGALVFLFCSTAYGIVMTLGRPGYGTLESEIWIQTTTFLDLRTASVLSVLQFVIVLVALVVSSRLTASTETSLKMRAAADRPVRRGDLPLVAGVLAIVVGLLVMPMLALVVGSLTKDGQLTLHNYRVLGEAGAGFTGGTSVLEAIEHSVKIAFDATWIALLVGVPLALVLSRRVRDPKLAAAQRFLDGFVLLPLGISAVTVGFGYFISLDRPPLDLQGSPMLVPLAQAVVALPMVVRALVPVLRAIDPRMREAAATLGAGPGRVLWTIDLPFMARGLGLAVGFAFAISLGEFGATSFLSSPDYQTLPVLIVRLLGRPGADNYGMALAGAVILAAVTAGVMMAAQLLQPKEARRG